MRPFPFQKCILLLTLLLPTESYRTKHLLKMGQICESCGPLIEPLPTPRHTRPKLDY